jgi:hypothetical protein
MPEALPDVFDDSEEEPSVGPLSSCKAEVSMALSSGCGLADIAVQEIIRQPASDNATKPGFKFPSAPPFVV